MSFKKRDLLYGELEVSASQPRAWDLYRALADGDVAQLREFVAQGLDVNRLVCGVGISDEVIQELFENLRARCETKKQEEDAALAEYGRVVELNATESFLSARRTYEAAEREHEVTRDAFRAAQHQLVPPPPWVDPALLVGRSDIIPLDVAVKHGRDAAVMVLLDAGAKLEGRNHYGDTPLHRAVNSLASCCNGFHSSVIFDNSSIACLLAAGADVNAVNDNGTSPLSLAIRGTSMIRTVSPGSYRDPDWLIDLCEEHPLDHSARKLIKSLLRAGAKTSPEKNPWKVGIHRLQYEHAQLVKSILQPIKKAGGWKPWVSKHRRILSSFVSKCAPLPVDVAGHVVDFAWPAGGW